MSITISGSVFQESVITSSKTKSAFYNGLMKLPQIL